MENPIGKTCEHCGKALVHRSTWATGSTTRQAFTCPDLHQTWHYDRAENDWHLDYEPLNVRQG